MNKKKVKQIENLNKKYICLFTASLGLLEV